MKTQLLGRSSLVTTRLAYGCMRVAGCWDPAAVTAENRRRGREAILAAYEAGYRLFDIADIYCRGVCEEITGEALRQASGMRQAVAIATKCGVRHKGDPDADAPFRYDFSAEHILRSCDGSLKRLGIETIDLYQLHRPDVLMDPDEVAGAFDRLRRQGKVREFGVSNFTPSQVTLLQSRLPMPLVVNQVEISLAHLAPFHDGTLDQCLADRITPLAWSPVARGMLADGGTVRPDHPERAKIEALLAVLDATAQALGAGRTAVTLAWLLRHPSGIVPIVGSADPKHIRQAAKADQVDLSREQWYRIMEAARGQRLA
jgi:predicted oxidoreductase